MTTIIADQAMKAALDQVKDCAEVRDKDGRMIGVFMPFEDVDPARYAAAAAKTDWAEIERREKANLPGIPSRQVFEYLKSLTTDETERAELQAYIDELDKEVG